MAPTRRTFVVSLRKQDGPTTVQEVRTGREVRLTSLRDIAGQIERWLRDARPAERVTDETD